MLRRPLGNGLPIPLTGTGTQDIVYSLTAASEDTRQRVHLVTLYAIMLGGDGSGTTTVLTNADGGTTELMRRDNTTLRAGQISSGEVPKILDRYPLRGNADIRASLSVDPAAQAVVIVGFVELEGVSSPAQALRPLQPSNTLVAPYTTLPTSWGSNAPIAQVHLLEEGRTDEIYLYGRIGAGGVSPHIVFNDGAGGSVDIDVTDLFATTGSGSIRSGKILDGIPMIGAGSLAGAGIQGYTTGIDIMTLYGSFIRR